MEMWGETVGDPLTEHYWLLSEYRAFFNFFFLPTNNLSNKVRLVNDSIMLLCTPMVLNVDSMYSVCSFMGV